MRTIDELGITTPTNWVEKACFVQKWHAALAAASGESEEGEAK